jgi:hypothetical protein
MALEGHPQFTIRLSAVAPGCTDKPIPLFNPWKT